MTGPALRLVANGLENSRIARAVLLIFPDKDGTNDWDFGDWPLRAHGLIEQLLTPTGTKPKRAMAHLEWRGDGPQSALLRDPFPKFRAPISEINDLWHRVLEQPLSAADDMLKAWTDPDSAGDSTHTRLPMPVNEAGLLLPLERARFGLGKLVPKSQLNSRRPMRPSASALSARGRPWLGRTDALVQIASLDKNAADIALSQNLMGPPDVGDWLRRMEQGFDISDHPFSAHLEADAIMRVALGRDNRDLLWLFDRMHALHHAAFNGVQRVADIPQSKDSDDGNSPAAQRRIQQLLSSPGLMRLFGFARDVYLDFEADLPANGLGTWGVMSESGPDIETYMSRKTSFELNRAFGLFYPATRAAYKNGNDPLLACGVRRLSSKLAGKSCYSAISIEPVASADEDSQAQANNRNTRVTTGPLALVCCDSDSMALKPTYDGEVDFAEELSAPAPDRLDIGIDTEGGAVQWYVASPRVVLYTDPVRKTDWPQQIIESLTPSWIPRTERDSAGLVSSTFQQTGQDGNRQTVPCFDPRVAGYTGEAIGARSNSIDISGNKPRWDTAAVVLQRDSDLVIDQETIIPTKNGELLAPLRFGWSYHFGIRRSFLGGAGPTLQSATSLYAKGADAPFPVVSGTGGGYRYLRHDPISKPMVLLAPDVPLRGKAQRIQLQTGKQMVVASGRLSDGGPRISHTSRIVVVPSVDAQFAAMHEVFDELGERGAVHDEIFVPRSLQTGPGKSAAKQTRLPLATHAPAQAFKNLKLYRNDASPAVGLTGQHRFEFGSGEQRASPYYPDPAACYLVFRLEHPERSGEWLSAPLVVRVRGDEAAGDAGRFSWPNLLPVRIDLNAVKDGSGLKLTGGEIFQEQGQSFRRVSVGLLPGESATLNIWAAPDAEDLLSWFDVIERSAQLCSAEGDACNCEPGLACATGRLSFLGDQSGPLQEDDKERRHLAEMYHQRLLEEPIFLFADTASVSLTHATDVPWYPASFVDAPHIARPISMEADDLIDFLTTAGRAADWGPNTANDLATAVVVGGTIEFDPTTTSGLVIEAEMLQPGSGLIDPMPPATPAQLVPNSVKPVSFSNGKPNFGAPVWTEVLSIQGIPLPADGRAGKRRYALEELMLGSVAEMRAAQFQYKAPLNTGQARQASFRIVPVGRYAPMLSNRPRGPLPDLPTPIMEGLSPKAGPVWILATIRPAAPDVKELAPTFVWTDANVSAGTTATKITSSIVRSTALRLVLRRPWFSSGEQERVGLVFWPPAILDIPQATGSATNHEYEKPSLEALDDLTEEDLSPVGPFVSVWGVDPIEAIEPGKAASRPRFLSLDDIALPDDAIKHPRVLMPLPGATPGKNDERFVTVSVVSFPVIFDEGALDGYVDLELKPITLVSDPIIRLGVVRMQLNARLDSTMTPLVSDPFSQAGIRCSPPVQIQAPLLPIRKLSATATELGTKHGAAGDQTSISVTLSGPAAPYAAGSLDTRVIIELVENIAGDEVAVRTIDGTFARNEGSNKSSGALYQEHTAGETIWTTSFLLAGKLAKRQIVARTQECTLMTDTAPDHGQPRFFGQITIQNPIIPN